jgi:hypothetical protein
MSDRVPRKARRKWKGDLCPPVRKDAVSMSTKQALDIFSISKRAEPMRKIEFVFYDTDKEGGWYDKFSQHLVGWFTAVDGENRFIHVELVFENGLSLGVDNVDPVHLNESGFQRPFCRHLTFRVPDSCYKKMYASADGYRKRKVKFNFTGENINFLPCVPAWAKVDKEGEQVFCSELLLRVMHDGGIFLDVTPHLVSPNMLFKILCESDLPRLNGSTNATKSKKHKRRDVVLRF